ncbi:hypothetical protein [Actinoplanes sp. GCM10030250]|uniref:hypothetical protein n=1 Tax=Actinoplanes sp. GCM10030250 TaxID=3273376 RepID=UPI00361CBDE7
MRAVPPATSWHNLHVGEMWSMIETHDGVAHQQLISGWRRSFELVLQHLSSVQRYRDNLAAAWPPSRSPAAAAYMERLDVLIASLRGTYEAAVENHRALSGATGALNSARREMEPIQREWAANEVRLAEFRAEMRLHHLVGGKARGIPPRSPIPTGRQAHLEERARRVMSSLSAELATAQVSLVTPELYKVPRSTDIGNRRFSAPAFPLSQTAPSFASDARSGGDPPQERAGARNSSGAGRATTGFSPGPALSGVSSPTAITPPGQSAPAVELPGMGSLPPGGVLGVPERRSPALAPGTSRLNAPPSPVAESPLGNLIPPSGAVIGAIPAAGTSLNSRAPLRVNPVGGIIGQPPPIAHPSRRSPGTHRGLERDTHWDVAGGTDPVIEPPRERKIDPGPVIGIGQPC